MIKFNQSAWLKPYIDMNTGLRKKMILKKIFFKLINEGVLGKTMDNLRKHRDIKHVTTERRRKYLMSELSYYNVLHWKSISNGNKKTEILMS